MEKTILQALLDEVHYPIGEGFAENKLMARNLKGNEGVTMEVLKSNEFIGAVADCLYSLIEAPNFNEADKSFSLADRNIILNKVNSMYRKIGEQPVAIEKPMVYFGSRKCQY